MIIFVNHLGDIKLVVSGANQVLAHNLIDFKLITIEKMNGMNFLIKKIKFKSILIRNDLSNEVNGIEVDLGPTYVILH